MGNQTQKRKKPSDVDKALYYNQRPRRPSVAVELFKGLSRKGLGLGILVVLSPVLAVSGVAYFFLRHPIWTIFLAFVGWVIWANFFWEGPNFGFY